MGLMNVCEICGAALDPGEVCDCKNNGLALICTQPPVIFENLDSVRQNLDTLLAEVSTLPANDESLKKVKQIRANLTKDFDSLERQRKEVKRQIMEPYSRAEEKYKACISDPYRAADLKLKEWVDGYQGDLKQKCVDTLVEYFNELCQAHGIDFLPFHRCGIVVDMAMARQKEPRKAMEQIYNCVMGVRSDMDTILKMDNAEEIMAEYRKYPVLATAIIVVNKRRQEQQEMASFVAQQKQLQNQQSTERAALMEAAPEVLPEQEERYTVAFKATGSIASLKAMKAHAIALGITFEEIEQEEEQ